ncbi:MAG: YD repeat-containing protein [Crocinitomicaceae bacterium]
MRILVIFFFLIGTSVFGQVLDNRLGEAFTDRPFFNEDFVRTNKLKRLYGTYTYKSKGQSMQETEYKYVYEFDKQGHLTSTFETRTDDGTKDTVWNIYKYDKFNNLASHRKTDLDGYSTVLYRSDSLGRVVEEEFIREIDSSRRIVRTISFNKERIEYTNYDNQEKRTRYNNYDLPYLDEFYNYNELGYLVERIERIKMTSTVYTYKYAYNREGKLASIIKTSNQKEGNLEELKFKYDELGNLIEKHVYKNGEFVTDIQIIYNSKTKLLSAVLTRQVSTDFILILRFQEYDFF